MQLTPGDAVGDQHVGQNSVNVQGDEVSLIRLGSLLLRRRRLISAITVLAALLGLLFALWQPRLYVASATFIPQSSEGSSSGLAAAASQFGLSVPSSGSAWGPAVYVELLRSRVLLDSISNETIQVEELGGQRIPVMDLLKIPSDSALLRVDLSARELQKIIAVAENKKINAVNITVATQWPSVSFWLVRRLVEAVDRFNLNTRNSQAAAERRFVEQQAKEAEQALRAAEIRLESFLQNNRVVESPELAMERDRLQRDVLMKQQIHTSLSQNREEARMREVRDTPVITILEQPRLPAISEPRKSVQKAVLSGVVGGILGIFLAFVSQGITGGRREPTDEEREFFALIHDATPRFLRKSDH